MVFRRKLPRSSFVLLSVSLACALAAGLVMRAYGRRLDLSRPDGGPPIDVVTAAGDVARGTVLTEDRLEVATIPSKFAPPGAMRDLARAVGRTVVADLAAGEILTDLRLAGADPGPTAALVPPGLRAVQVPVAAAVGVDPGDLVDVIATFGGGGAHTEVTGEALEVLAVKRGGSGGSFGAVGAGASGEIGLVLLVTPEDAQRLAFASVFASLSIAVRGPDDLLSDDGGPIPATTDG